MNKTIIPHAYQIINFLELFQNETKPTLAVPILGDPRVVTERSAANVRRAVRGENYNKNTKIPRAEKIVSKITLYNSNDGRIKKKFRDRGINVIDTGKTLTTISGVKLFRLEYGYNVNNQEFGTYIYMAEWVGGGINGITLDITERVMREMNEIEDQDQMVLMSAGRRNGGNRKNKRKTRKNKRKTRKEKLKKKKRNTKTKKKL